MSNLNEIGLNTEKSKNNAEKLNKLLANYSIFYQNTRGFHWNIKGDKFFALHVKFEELYNDLKVKIDEVAERILTLGYTPEHRYSKYNTESIIAESELISDGLEAVENILNAYSTILTMQREILDLAADANDEGTVALMSDYIQQQEKEVWMYSSLLNK
ncbi:Dps family protein [Salegentibacter salegens]|uniref:Starvation-inducible DNA-binding protein n=1 Tax=Salegentibacter salegens TaxID=143223 RepID=A0A1M7KW88_9FLAO|nr:Dps family protein [Salegentibacter salegens]PRX43827.1 starvation-inducible DNA-binding protein [Salegentibacter salegens]SHM69520.1 starvation-inducible DNA-binding protein [Salegentibacter salegens]